MKSNLSLINISKSFGHVGQMRQLFENFSYQFDHGISYAITGISGSGKSTLLALLAGIEKPSMGRISFNGKDLSTMDTAETKIFFQKIGLVFQVPHLIKELSVLQNVMIKGIVAGLSEDVCIAKGKELLEFVGLGDKADETPTVLSGGEQQRVAVARALCMEPDFLLADEPTAHLDEYNRNLVLKLLHDYQARFSTGIIVTSHDPAVAATMQKTLDLTHINSPCFALKTNDSQLSLGR